MLERNIVYSQNMMYINKTRKANLLQFLSPFLICLFVIFPICYYYKLGKVEGFIVFSIVYSFIILYILLGSWSIWSPPDQIYKNGLNISINISYTIRPKNRYVFIPFDSIKAIFLTQKKESDIAWRGKTHIEITYSTAGLGFITNKDFHYGKYVTNSFKLGYPITKEFIPILKKVLGNEKWKELINKPELFSEQLDDIQEELSLNGLWEPKEDLPT